MQRNIQPSNCCLNAMFANSSKWWMLKVGISIVDVLCLNFSHPSNCCLNAMFTNSSNRCVRFPLFEAGCTHMLHKFQQSGNTLLFPQKCNTVLTEQWQQQFGWCWDWQRKNFWHHVHVGRNSQSRSDVDSQFGDVFWQTEQLQCGDPCRIQWQTQSMRWITVMNSWSNQSVHVNVCPFWWQAEQCRSRCHTFNLKCESLTSDAAHKIIFGFTEHSATQQQKPNPLCFIPDKVLQPGGCFGHSRTNKPKWKCDSHGCPGVTRLTAMKQERNGIEKGRRNKRTLVLLTCDWVWETRWVLSPTKKGCKHKHKTLPSSVQQGHWPIRSLA